MIKHIAPSSGIAAFKNKYIATAGYDNRVILWDSRTKSAISCGFHDHLANQCAFSLCGQYLVSSSSDYSARVWKVPEMKLLSVLNDHRDDVEGVSFNPANQYIATASRDHDIRVFNFQGKLLKIFCGHSADVLSVAWLNEDELISCSDDGTVRCWSFSQAELLNTIDLGGIETDTIAIISQSIILAGNDEGQIIILDLKNPDKKIAINAHKAGIKRLCYNQAYQKLVSLSYDRVMKIWHFNQDQELELITTVDYPKTVWARSCDFIDENNLAFVSFTSCYVTFNLLSKKWCFDHCEPTIGINSVYLHQDHCYTVGDSGMVCCDQVPLIKLPSLCNFITIIHDRLLAGGQSGALFDAATGEVLYQHHSPLNCIASYSDDKADYAILGSYTGEAIILKVTAKSVTLIKILGLHQNAIKAIAIGDGLICSVCADASSVFYKIESEDNFTLQKTLTAAHDKIINDCAYFKDGYFASVGRDLTLRLTSLQQQIVIQTSHQYSIKCLAVSDNKKYIATGDYRGHVHLYRTDNKQWFFYKKTFSGISDLCYDTANKTFVASSYDGNVYPLEGVF